MCGEVLWGEETRHGREDGGVLGRDEEKEGGQEGERSDSTRSLYWPMTSLLSSSLRSWQRWAGLPVPVYSAVVMGGRTRE